ncbi:two pore domain potassium channel family protein [Candidatus Woesearchaeota archaeon]|nr:two pore domain potassium channel family protein [Candidatus Woesearchaeota archaeon]
MEEEEHRKYHKRLIYVFIVILLVLFGGAIFYHYVEGWRYLDALYFSSYTLTTVGYGDFVPKTDLGKIFTIIYVFLGVGMALYGLSLLASHFVEVREEFWLKQIGKIKFQYHTKGIWERLRSIFNFDRQALVSEHQHSIKKKK